MGCSSSRPAPPLRSFEPRHHLPPDDPSMTPLLTNRPISVLETHLLPTRASSSQQRYSLESSSTTTPVFRQAKSKGHRVVFTKGYTKLNRSELGSKEAKTPEELDAIMRALDSCYVFASTTAEQKLDLAEYMYRVEVNEGEMVIRQGDENSENFYAIQSGNFDFYVDAQLVAKRTGSSREAYFGELALLYDSPRQATAVCMSPKAVLWAINRDTFRQVLAYSNEQRREEKRSAVQSISFLREMLSEEQLNRVIEAVSLFHFPAGQRIVRKGDQGDSCFFIKQGVVLCTKIGEDQLGQVELGPGTYFGERALLRDEPRAADVTAVTDVVAMALDRKSFDELLGPLRAVMDDKMKERVMEALPILKELDPKLRKEVVADFELETFRQGDVIVQAGDSKCDKFYVIRAGEVAVYDNDKQIAMLREGSWFGEMALLDDLPRVATCIANTARVECFVLRRATFQQFSKQSKILAATSEARKEMNRHRRMSIDGGQRSPSSIPRSSVSTSSSSPSIDEREQRRRAQQQRIELPKSLNELDKLHILGKGTFGTVFLVGHRRKLDAGGVGRSEKRHLFALKTMNKFNLVRCEQQKNVLNEKSVLMETRDHPFVLSLYGTFQDRDSLYFLLEFCQGGELFSIMQDKFRFPLYPAFFYSACIVEVFDHLHSRGVVYRDLKPENVLLDSQGYVKLADFGFAKRVSDKTYTLCGTPEYLAPEVVLGVGHDKGVDYWGVGILIFEMLVGMSPFADEYDEDQHVVCTNIVKGKVAYDKLVRAIADTESRPDPFWAIPQDGSFSATNNISRSSKGALPVEDLIRKLLNKNPLQRLGNLKDGASDVKKHSFFCEVQDWEDLRQRRIQAPYVPVLKSDDDTSRFDSFEPDATWPPYKGPQTWCEKF